MSTEKYRAAVIGWTGRGDYGHGLDLAFRDHPNLHLVAVSDPDAAGRTAAAARLRVTTTYADYLEMLDRQKPQIVAVAPRWIDRHREMVVACAERGIHVFCEKPLAPTLADCDAIADACSRNHVKVAMAFQTRYSDRYLRAKALVDDGAIGRVLELRGRGKEDTRGGGEDLFVLGTHVFDMMRGFVGDPRWCMARVIDGAAPIDATSVREGKEGLGLLAGDRIDAMYGFGDRGVVGHFSTAHSDPPGRRFGVLVLGTKGSLFVGMGADPPAWIIDDPTWLGTGNRPARIEPDPAAGRPIATTLDAVNGRIIDDLIQSIERDRPPIAGLTDGIWAVEMVLATYASQVTGRIVELSMADRARHPLESLRGKGPS